MSVASEGPRKDIESRNRANFQDHTIGISLTTSLQANGLDEVVQYISQEAHQKAREGIFATKTQQENLVSSLALIGDTLGVLDALHARQQRYGGFLATQVQKEKTKLEKHHRILEQYISLVSAETQITLAQIRTAQQTMEIEYTKSKTSLETLKSNTRRTNTACSMISDTKRRYENLLAQAKIEEGIFRSQVDLWRQAFDTGRQKLELVPAGDVVEE